MAEAPKRSNFFQFILIFGLVFLASQFFLKTFFPEQFGGQEQKTGVHISAKSETITVGHHPEVLVQNKTNGTLVLPSRCPLPPFDVFGVAAPGGAETSRTSEELAAPCAETPSIPPGGEHTVSLAPWKYSLFGDLGTYVLRLPTGQNGAVLQGSGSLSTYTGSVLETRVTLKEPGGFTKAFRTFITAPFLNALIFIASLIPDHNLGLAIILLTIIVKLLLYIPTKQAMEGQKKMQLLQPKLDALKQKYPNDPKKVQEETMKLWAEHKVNPFQSCLPTLIQFPILIGLFYVIRDGSHLEVSRHLIYSFYQNLDWNFNTMFLGLDLLKPSLFIMPPLLVVLQFMQMKLAFKIQENKKGKSTDVIDVTKDGKPVKKSMSAQEMQQRIMLYGLPLMIGFFALQFPAAVALYWGISTLFGIGQQAIVNREHLRV